MTTTITKKTKSTSNKKKSIVNSKVKDYSNDPFFVKKAKNAEAFLMKHGLPNFKDDK
jgi:hypothetical protein